MIKRRLALVVGDVRSAYNVGSLLRTADSMGVERVYLTGISPYPTMPDDQRLPHVRAKADWDIHKTALGAEQNLDIKHFDEVKDALAELRSDGYEIIALEQTAKAQPLDKFPVPASVAIVVGNEVKGLDKSALKLCPVHVSIPMLGGKESLNVSVAAGIALYHLRFSGQT